VDCAAAALTPNSPAMIAAATRFMVISKRWNGLPRSNARP
jgi:hypothetical protein